MAGRLAGDTLGTLGAENVFFEGPESLPPVVGFWGHYSSMAVSTSGDPLGSYYLYDYLYSDSALNDYPHFGTWPDAYYMPLEGSS